MAISDVSLTFRDGALGIAPPNSNQTHLKLGVAALGVVNQIYALSDPTTAVATLGKGGPMVEAAALCFATQVSASGPVQGGPVLCVPVNPSTYGTASAVTKVGTGAETLTVAVKNAMALNLKCITAGAVSTSVFALSFDGGATWPQTFTSAATVMLPGCSLVTLAISGGSAVIGDTYSISTAGVVTTGGGNTGTQTVAISAASPLDTYSAVVTITGAGALGAATFTYSLDGGNTTSPTQLVPASGTYVIPDTGLVLTFSGTSTAGDYFTFTATPASFSTTDLANAMTQVLASTQTWAFAHVVGAPSAVAGAATLLAALDTQLGTAAAAYRYARGLIEVPSDTDANTLSGFATASSTRVGACAGYAYTTSALNGRVTSRNSAWHAAARASKVPPSEDLGRVASGSVAGITAPSVGAGATPVSALLRDERATPGLDAGRFTTLRTIIGRQGFYVTHGRLMAPNGSDYTFLQNGRVMDIAATAVRNALLTYLNDSVRVDSATGFILEKDARSIEAFVDGQLRAALTQPGYASDLTFQVSRTQNILSTGTLATTLRVVPLGYASQITVDLGFTNPALAVKAS